MAGVSVPVSQVVALGGTNSAFRGLSSWHTGTARWRICAPPWVVLVLARETRSAAGVAAGLAQSFVAWCGLLRVGPRGVEACPQVVCRQSGSFPGCCPVAA